LENDYQWDLQVWTVMTTTKGYDFLNRLTNTMTVDAALLRVPVTGKILRAAPVA